MNNSEYISYHRNNAIMWEIDTHLDAAVWFADRYNLDIEQRYWLAFLTAICETTPTSIYLFNHFPNYETMSPVGFSYFCNNNRGGMAFQYDVRWILYEIEKVLMSYKALVGDNKQSIVVPALATGKTKTERFLSFCKKIKVYKFGTYVLMLYTELLHHLCGVDFEACIDPSDNHSVRSGLVYACGLEDVIKCVTKSGKKPTKEERELMLIELSELIEKIQGLDISKRHKTVWAIETTLCTYNKTMHGRRYLGYYKNRQAKEIKRLADYTRRIGENFDWSDLINYHNNWGKWDNKYMR